jgi:hypothetical protein
MIVVCVGLGGFYSWAAPRAHPPDTRFGMDYGLLHGAMMPMAMPSLLMGNDVSIYAENNTGRPYKIGYIMGINLCGALFFGSMFFRSNRRTLPSTPAEPGESVL